MVDQKTALPTRIEAQRVYLRSYQAGDGEWFYAMSQKNRAHLTRYESENVVMTIQTEEEAEGIVRELAAAWLSRSCFFIGVFLQETDEFVGQIYVGPTNCDLPEFAVGFFADVDHQGKGYISEAVKATLEFIFEHLKAQRIFMEFDDTNEKSRRLAERCGLIREGHLRENKRNLDGSLSGTCFYGILKPE